MSKDQPKADFLLANEWNPCTTEQIPCSLMLVAQLRWKLEKLTKMACIDVNRIMHNKKQTSEKYGELEKHLLFL